MTLSIGEALAELTVFTKLKLIAGDQAYSHHVRTHLVPCRSLKYMN